MIKHKEDIRKVKECIYMLLESHRELLSGDVIEALEDAVVKLEKGSTSIESEAQKDQIQSYVIEVISFITKVAFKIFTEE